MSGGKTKLAIIYYSTYGHVAELAQKIKAGAKAVSGVDVTIFQVKETLPQEVLEKMHAPPQPEDIPFANPKTLEEYDAFIFGFPTRYGNMPAQFKAFWDATGGLWQKGSLVGKPFGLFTSTASIGGGQEVTHLASLPNFIHHGMIYVPIGYAFGSELFRLDEVRGGTPWGASTFAAGDGSRKPSKLELDQAEFQGKYCAEKFAKFNGTA